MKNNYHEYIDEIMAVFCRAATGLFDVVVYTAIGLAMTVVMPIMFVMLLMTGHGLEDKRR